MNKPKSNGRNRQTDSWNYATMRFNSKYNMHPERPGFGSPRRKASRKGNTTGRFNKVGHRNHGG